MKVLEYYHNDEEKYGKKILDEQVEPNYNISEDGNQKGKISNSP